MVWDRVHPRMAPGAPLVEAQRATERGDDDLYSAFERLAGSERFRKLAKWDELVGEGGA